MKKGNQDALSDLFRNHCQTLYDYGIKLCHNQELVKDCIQDIFIYIWEKRQNLSDIESVRAYLLVSFRRHLLKMLKKIRRQESKHQEIAVYFEEDAFSAEDFIAFQESESYKSQLLKEALNNIPTRMREALYLKTFNGLTYKAISNIMHISPQVARNYVSEAFQRLRKITANQT